MGVKEVKPWGVNVPFIILSIVYWALGGLSLRFDVSLHPYFMLLGAYSLFFGMVQRLFFPATKYFPLQILTLVLLAVPMYYFQIFASLTLSLTEVWALIDVKRYGGKSPVNILVLSSPPLSVIAWLLHQDLWVMIIPLLTYTLGVNIGVFTSNLRTRPLFGVKQIPLLATVLLTAVFHWLYYVIGIIYLLAIFRFTVGKGNLSAYITLFSVSVSPLMSLLLGDVFHSFFVGVMSPLFFSCIVYSTSRYNYGLVWVPVLLSFASYLSRDVSLALAGLIWALAFLSFLYLIKDSFTLHTIRYGVSRLK
ncbi:hypothetical protein [Stygiolobus caldivivus]|uniref:Uncharacterized protein n=1 Tax=Stygiolobus caldivivus TaxID=2824673 RepID=A0A8D5U5L3_9CREN|nr:hypothetical protein [Stygiolobus caldivivus]BCU69687.1 hypothetical protein KN1_09840 [Stygiolobus caldivivus]